jgi:hypothetical protein
LTSFSSFLSFSLAMTSDDSRLALTTPKERASCPERESRETAGNGSTRLGPLLELCFGIGSPVRFLLKLRTE